MGTYLRLKLSDPDLARDVNEFLILFDESQGIEDGPLAFLEEGKNDFFPKGSDHFKLSGTAPEEINTFFQEVLAVRNKYGNVLDWSASFEGEGADYPDNVERLTENQEKLVRTRPDEQKPVPWFDLTALGLSLHADFSFIDQKKTFVIDVLPNETVSPHIESKLLAAGFKKLSPEESQEAYGYVINGYAAPFHRSVAIAVSKLPRARSIRVSDPRQMYRIYQELEGNRAAFSIIDALTQDAPEPTDQQPNIDTALNNVSRPSPPTVLPTSDSKMTNTQEIGVGFVWLSPDGERKIIGKAGTGSFEYYQVVTTGSSQKKIIPLKDIESMIDNDLKGVSPPAPADVPSSALEDMENTAVNVQPTTPRTLERVPTNSPQFDLGAEDLKAPDINTDLASLARDEFMAVRDQAMAWDTSAEASLRDFAIRGSESFMWGEPNIKADDLPDEIEYELEELIKRQKDWLKRDGGLHSDAQRRIANWPIGEELTRIRATAKEAVAFGEHYKKLNAFYEAEKTRMLPLLFDDEDMKAQGEFEIYPHLSPAPAKAPWQMAYRELRSLIENLSGGSLSAYQNSPVIKAIYPDYPQGRPDVTSLSQRHRANIVAAIADEQTIPQEVLADYPDLEIPGNGIELAKIELPDWEAVKTSLGITYIATVNGETVGVQVEKAGDSFNLEFVKKGGEFRGGIVIGNDNDDANRFAQEMMAKAHATSGNWSGKLAWQMTRAEFLNDYLPQLGGWQRVAQANGVADANQKFDTHRAEVEKAVADGRTVPKEVLAEYPTLRSATNIEKGKSIVTDITKEIGGTLSSWEVKTNGWVYTNLSIDGKEFLGGKESLRVGVSSGCVVSIDGHPFDPSGHINTDASAVKSSILAKIKTVDDKDPELMSVADVKALSNESYIALHEQLENENAHSLALILRAKRTGQPEDVTEALDIFHQQEIEGELTAELKQRSDALSDKIIGRSNLLLQQPIDYEAIATVKTEAYVQLMSGIFTPVIEETETLIAAMPKRINSAKTSAELNVIKTEFEAMSLGLHQLSLDVDKAFRKDPKILKLAQAFKTRYTAWAAENKALRKESTEVGGMRKSKKKEAAYQALSLKRTELDRTYPEFAVGWGWDQTFTDERALNSVASSVEGILKSLTAQRLTPLWDRKNDAEQKMYGLQSRLFQKERMIGYSEFKGEDFRDIDSIVSVEKPAVEPIPAAVLEGLTYESADEYATANGFEIVLHEGFGRNAGVNFKHVAVSHPVAQGKDVVSGNAVVKVSDNGRVAIEYGATRRDYADYEIYMAGHEILSSNPEYKRFADFVAGKLDEKGLSIHGYLNLAKYSKLVVDAEGSPTKPYVSPNSHLNDAIIRSLGRPVAEGDTMISVSPEIFLQYKAALKKEATTNRDPFWTPAQIPAQVMAGLKDIKVRPVIDDMDAGAPEAVKTGGYLIMNAPRPIMGDPDLLWNGAFRHGRFYAAIDPNGEFATRNLQENSRLDAWLLVYVTEEQAANMARASYKRTFGDRVDLSDAAQRQLNETFFREFDQLPYSEFLEKWQTLENMVPPAKGMASQAADADTEIDRAAMEGFRYAEENNKMPEHTPAWLVEKDDELDTLKSAFRVGARRYFDELNQRITDTKALIQALKTQDLNEAGGQDKLTECQAFADQMPAGPWKDRVQESVNALHDALNGHAASRAEYLRSKVYQDHEETSYRYQDGDERRYFQIIKDIESGVIPTRFEVRDQEAAAARAAHAKRFELGYDREAYGEPNTEKPFYYVTAIQDQGTASQKEVLALGPFVSHLEALKSITIVKEHTKDDRMEVAFGTAGTDEDMGPGKMNEFLEISTTPITRAVSFPDFFNEFPPAGWSESAPGRIMTNKDPIRGAIIDKNLVSKLWFVIPHHNSIPEMEGFSSRGEAYAALMAEVRRYEAAQAVGSGLKLDDILVVWKPRFRTSVPPAVPTLSAKKGEPVFMWQDLDMLRLDASVTWKGEPSETAAASRMKIEQIKQARSDGYTSQQVKYRGNTMHILVKDGYVLTLDEARKYSIPDIVASGEKAPSTPQENPAVVATPAPADWDLLPDGWHLDKETSIPNFAGKPVLVTKEYHNIDGQSVIVTSDETGFSIHGRRADKTITRPVNLETEAQVFAKAVELMTTDWPASKCAPGVFVPRTFHMDFGLMGQYTVHIDNHPDIPDGHTIIASELYERKIRIPKRDQKLFGLENYSEGAFRISIVENMEGGRYSHVEYMGENHGGNKAIQADFNAFRTDALEGIRSLEPVNNYARKLWSKYQKTETQDLLTESVPGQPDPKRADLKPWQQPSIVFREIRDNDGVLLGYMKKNYDGRTKEDALDKAQALTAEQVDAVYPTFSNINSRIGATDSNGNPLFAISPNLKHVHHVLEDRDAAMYVWGDLEAGQRLLSEADHRERIENYTAYIKENQIEIQGLFRGTVPPDTRFDSVKDQITNLDRINQAHRDSINEHRKRLGEAPAEREPHEYRAGDLVEFKGDFWEVGFVNQSFLRGTLRLQKSGAADAEQANYVYPEKVRLISPALPQTKPEKTPPRESRFDQEKEELKRAYAEKGYTLYYQFSDNSWNLTIGTKLELSDKTVSQGQIRLSLDDKEEFRDVAGTIEKYQTLLFSELGKGHVKTKLDQIKQGRAVVMSDEDLDLIGKIDPDSMTDICSIPNPNQMGTKDLYLAGLASTPEIKQFRINQGIEQTADDPEPDAPAENKFPPVLPYKDQWFKHAKHIGKLLNDLGIAEEIANTDEYYRKVFNDPWMPLTIERHGDRIYFTHYYKQNGDLVMDGEMVFQIFPETGHLKLIETAVQNSIRGGELRGIDATFANIFASNLNKQRYGECKAVDPLNQNPIVDKPGEPLTENLEPNNPLFYEHGGTAPKASEIKALDRLIIKDGHGKFDLESVAFAVVENVSNPLFLRKEIEKELRFRKEELEKNIATFEQVRTQGLDALNDQEIEGEDPLPSFLAAKYQQIREGKAWTRDLKGVLVEMDQDAPLQPDEIPADTTAFLNEDEINLQFLLKQGGLPTEPAALLSLLETKQHLNEKMLQEQTHRYSQMLAIPHITPGTLARNMIEIQDLKGRQQVFELAITAQKELMDQDEPAFVR